MRGRLIVFEGGEGAGKSTQLRRLSARLTATGIAHAHFREPGGTPVGDRIRELLLHGNTPMAARTEAALFIASRAELVATAVRPALERGDHVLLDRFLLSTYAYQIHGRGLPEEIVRTANALATDGLVPDLTLLLTLRPSEGLQRAGARSAADRIERAEAEFHEKVAAAFARFAEPAWQAAHPECGPIVAIPGDGDVDRIEAQVLLEVSTRLPAMTLDGAGAR